MRPLTFENHPKQIQTLLAAALEAANPEEAVAKHLKRDGRWLTIGSHTLQLGNGRLFILGIGKAAVPMVQAALDIVGETAVAGGGIITKSLPEKERLPLPAYEADHPVPGAKSVAATTAVLSPLTNLTPDDLVLCLISGGASALFTQPLLPLAGWQQLNQALLASGCPIQPFNIVRGQLDAVKAGGLAQMAAPASVISLILSDVVGSDLAAIGSGPTVASRATPAEALAVLHQYGILEQMETAVCQTILATLEAPASTPQAQPNNIIDNLIIGSVQQSAEAAAGQAAALGFHTRLLTTRLEGEAREAGRFAAALAKDAPPQSATILGGETTVTLRGNGIGGRNLETALAAAISLAGWPLRTITCFATDGDDGPSGMAGATVTGHTVRDIQAAQAHLNNNDSYTYFARQDDLGNGSHLIKTGPTGTNVNDLIIILNYEQE